MLLSTLFILVLSGFNLGKKPAPPLIVEVLPEVTAVAPTPIPMDLVGPQVGTQLYWADNSLLVYVPGGEFTMGSDAVLDNQKHTETLSPYWIYQSKVTNRQYQLCIQAGICVTPVDPSAQKALTNADFGDNPILSVKWDQASAYCTWIQGTLPTEAQWELAARGPNWNLYPWGDAKPACDLLNFNTCLGVPSKVDNYPSGKSFYNTLDMSGNVFEWVGDWYAADYYKNSPAQDPTGPETGKERSIRSSSYFSNSDDVLPSKRFFQNPTKSRLDLGFRCVVEKPAVLASACQTGGIASTGCSAVPFTAGATTGCSTSPSPRVVRNTNGCNQGAGFGTIIVSGSYELGPGGTPGCTTDSENRITCTGNGQTATVSVCNPTVLQAPPGGATACPIGYSPSPDGGCMYSSACPIGFAPGANGCEVVPPLLVPLALCKSPQISVPGQGCVEPESCEAPKIFFPGAGCIDSPICLPPQIYIPGSGCIDPLPLGICEFPKIMDPFRGCIEPISDIIHNCPIGFYNVSGTDPAVCLPPEPIGCAAYAAATGRNCVEDAFTRTDNNQTDPPKLVPTVPAQGGSANSVVAPALVHYLNNPAHLPNLCPAGTYFDIGSLSCVSPSGPGLSGQTGAAAQCLAGYNYNPTAMCCQGAAYSGCPAGEVLFGGTCAPADSVTGSNCTDFSVNTGTCGGDPGGNDSGDDPGDPGSVCPPPTTYVCSGISHITCVCK